MESVIFVYSVLGVMVVVVGLIFESEMNLFVFRGLGYMFLDIILDCFLL